ncbi:hypothetical protein BGZ96_001774 [Linnemannia gamsii]|uniref:F-box domain-containing protein n=1 Tax=Linnemannia gamsii TaxID=64522 RepID=A0ABQ7JLT5_9FUNG|nr:hypothetical protein BGZ96_001774 [Linnemannia gamsii]
MLDLLPEILFEIGKLLDGPTLVTCLQVALAWHNTLYPLAWRSISHRHWIRGEFPLMYWLPLSNENGPHTKVQKQREAKILWGLQHTRSLTFHNVKTIQTKNPFSPQRLLPVPATQFFLAVQNTPNLVHFSLAMVIQGPSDDQLSLLFKLLEKMPMLEAVEIILSARTHLVAIEQLFPLFAKLKELKIAGRWYTGTPTLGPVSDNIKPWKLQDLKIDRFDISFLPYCPMVKDLTLDLNGIKESNRPVNPLLRKKILDQVHGLSKLDAVTLSMHCFGQVDVQKFVKHDSNPADKSEVVRWKYTPRFITAPQWSVRKKKPDSPSLFTLEDIFALVCG